MTFDIKTLEFNKILEAILPYAHTEQGKENIKAIYPITKIATIETMLEETAEAVNFIENRIEPSFTQIADIRAALSRAKIHGVLTIRQCIDIYQHIVSTKRIKREMMRLRDIIEKEVLIEYYAHELEICTDLKTSIETIMNEQGEILSTASNSLKTIRQELANVEKRTKTSLDEILRKEQKRLTESIVTMRYERYVIPVKISEKNNVKGTILDYSNSGETAYIEPDAIRELTNKRMRLEAEEKHEIERLLYMLTELVYENHDTLKHNAMILGQLDALFAKAKYCHNIEGTKPKIGKQLNLIKARHPLISKDEVVANTITFDEGVKTMVITGSNTGGKTVTLKTIGLLSIMVQSGLLIPVLPNSQARIYNQIRADIGDEQSIEQSLSTFSSHMNNIVRITNTVEDNSLILLDELGSGTDPKEGSSLAMSILNYLDHYNVHIVATTHYPELKAYAYTKESIVNASVEFDEKTLKPTYRLLLRTPGESHAFLISERLGLNQEIIEDAKSQVLTSKSEISDLIQNLRTESQRLDAMVLEYEQLLDENRKTKQSLEALKKDLQTEKTNLKEKMMLENQKVLINLKQEAQQLINELESLKQKSFKEHELAELKYQVRTLADQEAAETLQEEHTFKVNDTVYIPKFNRYGELVKKLKGTQWEVQMGRLTSVFKENEFQYSDTKQVKKSLPKSQTPKKKDVSSTLDLRGLRVHEAEEAIFKYLDDCAIAGMPFSTIIHGFGTLALRKMVKTIVSESPLVKRHRDGEGNEGGQGVTIVYFEDEK